jgi:asparagine synthase (glutamine-hydrolysing)
MCGIVGAVWTPGSNGPEGHLLESAVGALRHRGPDESSVHLADGVAFGHTRLSIIDLAHGSQPMANEDGSVITIYNGEIWNFRELRHELAAAGHQFRTNADTEVLVHGYEEWGDDIVSRLAGMFAFAIWDARGKRLLLARDRLGKKPLFYARTAEGLVFGSDVRSVLIVGQLRPRLDEDAVPQFLFQRYVNAPRTLYRDIVKLPPGHLLTHDHAGVATGRYWSIPASAEEPMPRHELRSLLHDATRQRLMSDVPLGILLSGGVDSSAILGLMRESGAESVASFTIGFPDRVYDERPLARVAAARWGSEHHELEVASREFADALPSLAWFRDEPVAEASEIPLYLLASFARQHVKVLFSGEGGDELFGGYPKYRAERLLRTGIVPTSLVRHVAKLAARRESFRRLDRAAQTILIRDPVLRWTSWFRSFSPEDLGRLLAPSFRSAATEDELTRPLRAVLTDYADLDPGRRMLVADLQTYLPDNMLARGDKVLMAASIEGRMPLLDHRLVERVCRIPASERSGILRGKAILRKAVADLVPAEILHKPKRGFPVPVTRLLFDAAPQFAELLLSERTLDRGLFEAAEVERIVRAGEIPRAERELKLFTLLSFELWLRANIDEVRLTPPRSLDELVDDASPVPRPVTRNSSHSVREKRLPSSAQITGPPA